jgi:hypothetical protein
MVVAGLGIVCGRENRGWVSWGGVAYPGPGGWYNGVVVVVSSRGRERPIAGNAVIIKSIQVIRHIVLFFFIFIVPPL